MAEQSHKVVIVPCSGIGKTYGTVSREAAYDLVEELRPETTGLVGPPRDTVRSRSKTGGGA